MSKPVGKHNLDEFIIIEIVNGEEQSREYIQMIEINDENKEANEHTTTNSNQNPIITEQPRISIEVNTQTDIEQEESLEESPEEPCLPTYYKKKNHNKHNRYNRRNRYKHQLPKEDKGCLSGLIRLVKYIFKF